MRKDIDRHSSRTTPSSPLSKFYSVKKDVGWQLQRTPPSSQSFSGRPIGREHKINASSSATGTWESEAYEMMIKAEAITTRERLGQQKGMGWEGLG